MAFKTQAQLLSELSARIRSGSGGKTTAQDLREFLTSLTAYVDQGDQQVLEAAVISAAGTHPLPTAAPGKVVRVDATDLVVLQVPANNPGTAGFPVGAVLEVLRYGPGEVQIVAGASVTLRQADEQFFLGAQYASASLRQIQPNEWILSGYLKATADDGSN